VVVLRAVAVLAVADLLALAAEGDLCVWAVAAGLLGALPAGFGGGAASPKVTGASSCSAALGTAKAAVTLMNTPAASRQR